MVIFHFVVQSVCALGLSYGHPRTLVFRLAMGLKSYRNNARFPFVERPHFPFDFQLAPALKVTPALPALRADDDPVEATRAGCVWVGEGQHLSVLLNRTIAGGRNVRPESSGEGNLPMRESPKREKVVPVSETSQAAALSKKVAETATPPSVPISGDKERSYLSLRKPS